MTGEVTLVLICAIDLAFNAAVHAGAGRPRRIQARAHCTQACRAPAARKTALQKVLDARYRAEGSRRPPILRWNFERTAWRRQTQLTRQHCRHVQSALPATRTQQHIDLGHPCHEGLGRLHRLRAGRRHLQSRPGCWQFDCFAATGQHPIVANPLDPARQDVQQEAAHKLSAMPPCAVCGSHCLVQAQLLSSTHPPMQAQ